MSITKTSSLQKLQQQYRLPAGQQRTIFSFPFPPFSIVEKAGFATWEDTGQATTYSLCPAFLFPFEKRADSLLAPYRPSDQIQSVPHRASYLYFTRWWQISAM